MFKKITLWCEFPDTVYWKKAIKLIDFKVKIYIAVKSKKEFLEYKKKIKSKYITLGTWPVLSRKEGYWFSGFSSKQSIDKLKQFKGMDIKIDLEPPIFEKYSDIKVVLWGIEMFLKKAKNKKYLKNTIYWLAKHNTKILLTQFPLPKFYLKKTGITVEKKKNIRFQIMIYTTPVFKLFRPLMRIYQVFMLKKALKKDPDIYGSVGLIGPGILETEGIYSNVKEFEKDLRVFHDAGLKNLVVYSIDSIMHRENPKEWLDTLKKFIS